MQITPNMTKIRWVREKRSPRYHISKIMISYFTKTPKIFTVRYASLFSTELNLFFLIYFCYTQEEIMWSIDVTNTHFMAPKYGCMTSIAFTSEHVTGFPDKLIPHPSLGSMRYVAIMGWIHGSHLMDSSIATISPLPRNYKIWFYKLKESYC